MTGKRQNENNSDCDEPKAKRMPKCNNIGPVASLEELGLKTLHFQNSKLTERLDSYRQDEAENLEQIESMKAKLAAYVSTLSLVSRSWEQLNENLMVDASRLEKKSEGTSSEFTEEDDEKKQSFHRLQKSFDFQEMKEVVSDRLSYSRRFSNKIIDVLLKEKVQQKIIAEKITSSAEVNDATKQFITKLQKDNENLNELMNSLRGKHDEFLSEKTELRNKVEENEDQIADLQEDVQTAKWELKKARRREEKLTKRLQDCVQQSDNGALVSNEAGQNPSASGGSSCSTSKNSGGEKNSEGEWQKLAESRLAEVEQLKQQNAQARKEVERLKVEAKHVPEVAVLNSLEYKNLQSQFSVLYHESVQLKNVLDETRNLLQQTKINFSKKMDKIEGDEFANQKKLRNEFVQLEQMYEKKAHELQVLHREFEQHTAANEQAGPVNREMRHLINSLQNQNRQLKAEGQRYKKKCQEMQNNVNKLREELEEISSNTKNENNNNNSSETEKQEATIEDDNKPHENNEKQRQQEVTTIKQEVVTNEQQSEKQEQQIKMETGDDMEEESNKLRVQLQSLKTKLEEESEERRKLQVKLDAFANIDEEKREKAELATSEGEWRRRVDELEGEVREARSQVVEEGDKLRAEARRLQGLQAQLDEARCRSEKFEKNHRNNEVELSRKVKALEETVSELRRNLAATKQEEEALLTEMDVTGTAFEDMQEQNMRLLQQLREKDDANLKLMSEKYKALQIQKHLQEEKKTLDMHATNLTAQVESQNMVVRKLEEKERVMHTALISMEKEANLRLQMVDINKKKALESAQVSEDLKREMEKYKERISTLEESVEKKVETIEEEQFKMSRIQEDSAKLRRKLEKHKKSAGLYTADEVLMEEIKEYKTKLRCPCCNVNTKDAVLTKCYHVFCYKCIQKRYETRQRKCPKCNAGFGGNDFHRIYIE